VIANASSSSGKRPVDPDLLRLDLLSNNRLPKLPTAFLQGKDWNLLSPVRFLPPGKLPTSPSVKPLTDRAELAKALESANQGYGHPAANSLAQRLADPSTRVVVTGQQPGLYGGPLYSLNKMIAAVRWAEAMTAAGDPTVAVFWVATEDHDWTELAQATFLDRDGARRVDLGPDPAPLMPLGMRTFGPGLEETERQLEGFSLPPWYRPHARFGEAFCRLMIAALGERAPLMLDSMLPAIKQLQRPWLRKLIDHREDIRSAQSAADTEIRGRGYSLQVKPQQGLSPLFMLQGQERRRIAWVDDKTYALRGLEDNPLPLAQLHETLRDNPSVISPGVLARPAIQDALLGTTLQIMGPAELSYMPQVAPIYSILGIDSPWTTLRPQAMVLEERHAGYLEELGISLEEILDVPVDRLIADRLGDDIIGPARQQVESLMESLHEPLSAIDRSLEGPLRKTQGHFSRGFDQLTGKVAGAVARRHEVWARRLEQVRMSCLPGGHTQERTLSVAHFLSRYGDRFASTVSDGLGLDPRKLHVIRISDKPRSHK